jgi:hypothetical protein
MLFQHGTYQLVSHGVIALFMKRSLNYFEFYLTIQRSKAFQDITLCKNDNVGGGLRQENEKWNYHCKFSFRQMSGF